MRQWFILSFARKPGSSWGVFDPFALFSGMPPQCLMCPEVAISQWIHMWECKSASNQPCESSNVSSGRWGQEPWASVALWRKADVVTAGTFLGHVCPAVGCSGRNSGLGWCQRSIYERSWLFPLGCSLQQSKQGRIQGERLGWSPPLKPTKVTLLAMILYYSENSIRDTRPFCRPLFCHSSVVK